MVSITLGLIVVMAATALLVSSKVAYITQDDDARIDDAGRYAIESISRSIRQAAYVNWDRTEAPVVATGSVSANIAGIDSGATAGPLTASTSSMKGSDVLAIRFFGSGTGSNGDGTMVNCAGFGVAAATSQASAEDDRGWSIFYVNKDAFGEPQLYCRYKGANAWATAAIARGIESFQVLYGVDTDGDGLPNQLLSAAGVSAMDAAAGQGGGGTGATFWKKIVTVRISLLIRGLGNAAAAGADLDYDLFGKEYSSIHAADDVGVHYDVVDFQDGVRNRARKIFTATVQLRNHSAASGT